MNMVKKAIPFQEVVPGNYVTLLGPREHKEKERNPFEEPHPIMFMMGQNRPKLPNVEGHVLLVKAYNPPYMISQDVLTKQIVLLDDRHMEIMLLDDEYVGAWVSCYQDCKAEQQKFMSKHPFEDMFGFKMMGSNEGMDLPPYGGKEDDDDDPSEDQKK